MPIIAAQPQLSPFAPKTNSFYSIDSLSLEDLPSIMGLMNKVVSKLKGEGKASYVLPKPAEVYAQHLHPDEKSGFVIGMKDRQAKLVGSVLLDFIPHQGAKETGLTPCPGIAPLLEKLQKEQQGYCVIENAFVSSENRGHGLMSLMMGTAMSWVQSAHNIQSFVAEVVPTNLPSLKSFMHCEFSEAAHGVDESDGTPLVFLHKSMKKPNLKLVL